MTTITRVRGEVIPHNQPNQDSPYNGKKKSSWWNHLRRLLPSVKPHCRHLGDEIMAMAHWRRLRKERKEREMEEIARDDRRIQRMQQLMTEHNLDEKLMSFGIGGLAKQFQSILISAFASKCLPSSSAKKLDHEHVKGMILYGVPGTGKTLLAKVMADIFEAKVINGPEILSSYNGDTANNMKKVFDDAMKEFSRKGERSRLHFIMFDEIDSIARARGPSDNEENSSIVHLSKLIDGFKGVNNVFIIGTTSRFDLIDPSLLRPGRLELQFNIGLPDSEGRYQILNVHTKKLLELKMLEVNDDFIRKIAMLTDGWSGADLTSLVREALSQAMVLDSSSASY